MTLLVVLVLLGADVDPLKDAAVQIVADARDSLAEARRELSNAKKARVNARAFGVNQKGERIYRNASDKREAIALAESKVEAAEQALKGDGLFQYLPPARKPPNSPMVFGELSPRGKPGDIGLLHGPVEVIQIVSPGAAVVDVDSIVDAVGQYSAWLETDTSRWVDDNRYTINEPVIALGTKSYETLAGKRTILHVRVLTDDEVATLRDHIKEEAKKYDTAPKR